MQKRVTIQDVAKQAGVSITTVSRYLNGRFDAMSEDTQHRIRDVIATLNYQPNVLAQGLKGNRSKTVAVVVVNIGYPFCVSLIRALQDVFTPAGYSLVVVETGGDSAREYNCLLSLQAQQVDAFVLQTNGDNNRLVEEMATRIPVVFVDRQFPIPGVTSVITNNEVASFDLTSHLFLEGYRRVLYVTEAPDKVSTRTERIDGYRKACKAHKIAPWIALVDRNVPSTFTTAAEQLSDAAESRSPQAVYTANGLLMLELYPFLRTQNWPVPSQLGIATFDEPDWVHIATPSITCVRQPVADIGAYTANTVLHLLEDYKKPETQVQILDSVLVLRDSTRLRTSRVVQH